VTSPSINRDTADAVDVSCTWMTRTPSVWTNYSSLLTITVCENFTQLQSCSPAVDSGPPTVFLCPQISHPWQTSAWQNYVS